MRAPAAAAAMLLLACRAQPPAAEGEREDAAFRAALSAGDAAFARRGQPARLAEALASYRRAAAERPGDPEAEIRLARGEAFRALAQGESPAARESWIASARAAERALRSLSPAWAEAVDAGADAADATGRVEPPGAEALYWLGLGTLRAAQAAGYAALLSAKDSVLPTLERSAELDEGVDAAGAHRALGALRAALPVAAGGGVASARAHFDRARALFPREQLARVLEAEALAVLLQDGAAFDRLLAEVAASDPAAWPEREAENAVARERARALAERRARLF
ncbi:MAG TPA: TRAP transporter TatT component family protein [Anaeromyxobacteraceae bacterium]|nr:TRAP transporter TatT component family protein [Anaeromyxobacteraceae bacterium]